MSSNVDEESVLELSNSSGRGTPQTSGRGTPQQASGRGTPQNSGRGTPQMSNPGTPRSLVDDVRNTPPPTSIAAAAAAAASPALLLQQQQAAAAAVAAAAARHPPQQPQSKYASLLAVIEDMGKDIRPTYSGSKTSAERLKRGIVHARILVRECLMECERAARS